VLVALWMLRYLNAIVEMLAIPVDAQFLDKIEEFFELQNGAPQADVRRCAFAAAPQADGCR
jgi:hypothetical protein